MNRLLRCFVPAILLSSTSAHAGWENTEWGMTTDKVMAVTPRVLEPSAMMAMGGISGVPWAAALKELRDKNEPYSATYYFFDDTGLAVVFQYNRFQGDRATSDCDGKLDELINEYGIPQIENVTSADVSDATDYLFARADDGTSVKVRITLYDDEPLRLSKVCLIGFDSRVE